MYFIDGDSSSNDKNNITDNHINNIHKITNSTKEISSNHSYFINENEANNIPDTMQIAFDVVSVKYYFLYRHDVFKQWMCEDQIKLFSKIEKNAHLLNRYNYLIKSSWFFAKMFPDVNRALILKKHEYNKTYSVHDMYFCFPDETFVSNMIHVWMELKKTEFHELLNFRNHLTSKNILPKDRINYNLKNLDLYMNTPLEHIKGYIIDECIYLHLTNGYNCIHTVYFLIEGISIDTVSYNNISYKIVFIHYENKNEKSYLDVLIPLSCKAFFTNEPWLIDHILNKKAITCFRYNPLWSDDFVESYNSNLKKFFPYSFSPLNYFLYTNNDDDLDDEPKSGN